MKKEQAKSHMKQNRLSKEPKNKELIEFLKLFKTSVILEVLGWENNHSNGQKFRTQRIIYGNFRLDELMKIHVFILNINASSVDYYVVKEIDILKKKKALKKELENL